MGADMEMGRLIDMIFGSICVFLLFLIFNLGFPIMTIQTGMLAYQNYFLLHDTPVALMYLALAIYAGIITIMTLYVDVMVIVSLITLVVRWLTR